MSRTTGASDGSRRSLGLMYLLFAAISFAVFAPSLRGEFIMDDWGYITQNPWITATSSPVHFWTSLNQNDYWPLSYTMQWIAFRAFGQNPMGYHVVNILLHSLNALVLFCLARRLRLRWAMPLSLLFLLHPLQVQAVSWIVQLKTLLAASFALLTVFLYIQGRVKTALLTFLLALLAKTSVVLLPLILWGFDGQRPRRRLIPFFALAVLAGTLTLLVDEWNFTERTAEVFQLPWLLRPLLIARTFIFYFTSALFPYPLGFMYPVRVPSVQSVSAWASLFALISVLGVLLRTRPLTSADRAPFFILAYFIALFPALGLVPIPGMKLSLVTDHWSYFANAFLALSLGASLRNVNVVKWLAPPVLVLCAALSFSHAAMFESEAAFWSQAAELNPQSAIPDYNLGTVADKRGDSRSAAAYYDRALSKDPRHARAWFNRGRLYFTESLLNQARESFEHAVANDRSLAPAYLALAEVELHLLNPEKARTILTIGLDKNPSNRDLAKKLAGLNSDN